ncbi:MAG TPA: phosphoenolpyruvate--protein phosphotransferase [Verrucomicrobiota bacterium]|nr:phosphoenolpyruvate--protein phosphotransferase [Verrucomicrobiota bacterium]HNT13824.1 phosphoenolpyruvate--protein phosphotransferase [Verrucomicrobiota bacterium]
MAEQVSASERILRGIPVSPGVCQGRILVLDKTRFRVEKRLVPDAEISGELNRFQQALVKTREQMQETQRQLLQNLGANHAGIFDAHLLVLEDPSVIDEVVRRIQEEKVNAEYAFGQVTERYIEALARVEDEYLRERASDLRDVSGRIMGQLLGVSDQVNLAQLSEPCILIAHDLSPTRTAQLDRKNVLGFATDIGSRTSHTAIMAQSLRIPAVVGLKDASEQLASGEFALLDGFNGRVVINPTASTLAEYGQLVQKQVSLAEKLRGTLAQEAITLDRRRIVISANIERAEDVDSVRSSGAEGVGLFRTEYLFLNRDHLPTEAEQYQAYRQVAEALRPDPVVIRTLDLGADKLLPLLGMPAEMNPALGWRAIRYCLQHEEIFRTQLRAILRASPGGNVKLMYPMISGLDELIQANAFLEQCKAELRKEGVPFDPRLEVGIMVETPAAVAISDLLSRHAQFFSLGTNDLIQYTLAVDRVNEKIAHLYEPTHPAIIRLIHQTVQAARARGIWVSVCGELAGEVELTPLLLGLGVDELSAAPPALPPLKFLLRRLQFAEAQELVQFALKSESAAEILSRSVALARRAAPSLFEAKK